ncbi:MAG: multiprotein bridging factor aMBF1 [Candidatus Bathyarchaeota archaeon]|nr:multiprotein bridging factor aMBF1 [Candidatus Bathyarchaeota archaeon]
MRCEVCGHRIVGKPYRATIEGAKMIVCGNCVKLSSASWKLPSPQRVKRPVRPSLPKIVMKKQPPEPTEELELVGDFRLRVKRGREKLGLSHKDLGRKIGEKVSLLRKIESGKMTPDHKLASKLEYTLRVKLLAPLSEPKVPSTHLPQLRKVTLGEVAHVKKKTEVTKEREQA